MEEVLKIDEDAEILYADNLIGRTAYENFGIKYLFPWQQMVISNILEAYEYHKMICKMTAQQVLEFNKENTDSFCLGRQIVLLPTGAGKSLCFQIPALLLDGPTLIVYPLLALMTDQQRRMEEGSLRSVTFRGGQTLEERRVNFEKLKNGAKIILANPEVLACEDLLEELKTVGIKHIAIDEAHCVSEWGDSFRPGYLQLGKVIEKINPPVITAFTATASPEVLSRVSQILFNGEAHVVRSESDRKNIHYFVKKAAAKKKEILYLVKNELHPMIVFCGTRTKAEDMAREINACFGKGTAKFYHAGLEKSEKDFIEKWFYESKDGVLCATCAYGMGVDKKDIKTVVHLEPSATAEAYIQEAGRGGRDGSVAKAILVWSPEDSVNFGKYDSNSRQAAMKKFAETKDCRRQVLLDALGAEQAVCSGCDLCNSRNSPEKKKSYSDWESAYRLIKRHPHFYTEQDIEMKLFENMNGKSRAILHKNIWEHGDVQNIIAQLKETGFVRIDNGFWKKRLVATGENTLEK